MVIQSTAESGQLSAQVLTMLTVLLLAATTLLLTRKKHTGTAPGEEAEE